MLVFVFVLPTGSEIPPTTASLLAASLQRQEAHLGQGHQHDDVQRPQLASRRRPPRQRASSSQRPRQSSHPKRCSNERLDKLAILRKDQRSTKRARQRQSKERGRQWSPRRAWREQRDRCRVRGAGATRGHASHSMQQQPGHGCHQRRLGDLRLIVNPFRRAWCAEQKRQAREGHCKLERRRLEPKWLRIYYILI